MTSWQTGQRHGVTQFNWLAVYELLPKEDMQVNFIHLNSNVWNIYVGMYVHYDMYSMYEKITESLQFAI